MEMTADEKRHMEEREKKSVAKNEGLEINNNKQPVYTEGRVTGSNAAIKANMAKLMRLTQHGAGKKSNNYKEAKKANIRRNEKY